MKRRRMIKKKTTKITKGKHNFLIKKRPLIESVDCFDS